MEDGQGVEEAGLSDDDCIDDVNEVDSSLSDCDEDDECGSDGDDDEDGDYEGDKQYVTRTILNTVKKKTLMKRVISIITT